MPSQSRKSLSLTLWKRISVKRVGRVYKVTLTEWYFIENTEKGKYMT